ncbi:MAG: PD40 domain-containing protein [Bryobacterales bacterium]|nr:PD40 domain-containing protein [Bryobacterales bacterium]
MDRRHGEIPCESTDGNIGERILADPLPSEVRSELDRILDSPEFLKAKRSARLLRFLVEQTLEARGRTLKEFVIALEVFDRDQTFDPRIDSLVRVEAARLRVRLNSYYARAGPGGIRIELHAGSYVPAFVRPSANPVLEPRQSRALPSLKTLGASAFVVALLSFGLWTFAMRRRALGEIHIRNAHQITGYSGITAYPALSPGSDWAVCSSDRGDGEHLHLWKYSFDGDEPRQLTSGPQNDIAAAVSPDGKWIAFESSGKPAGIYLIPSVGGERALVAPSGLGPRFSPDGRWLAYWSIDPSSTFGRVFIVPVGRAGEPVQAGREFDDAHTPAWTPGGEGLLICGTRQSRGGPNEEHDLWFIPLEGRNAAKTGAFAALAKAGVDAHTNLLGRTSFQWLKEGIVFPGSASGRIGLWWLPLSAGTWRVRGSPVSMALATDQQIHPSVQGGTLAFTSASAMTNVWSVPLNANGAKATGEAQRLTDDASDQLSPSISADGGSIVFLSGRESPKLRAYKKDLASGGESLLSGPSQATNRLKISPDGSAAYYRVFEGPEPQLQAIHSVDLLTGRSVRVCRDCGAPTHVSPDGRLVVFETGSSPTRLAAMRVDSGEKWEFARHSHYGMRSARVAPDGRWIAFHADRGWEGKQIFVAPFRDTAPIDESQWIPVTETGGVDQEAWWSPNGVYLYFLSDRDGHRCIWAQKFDPRTGEPAGSAIAVYHFHEARLTPLSFLWRDPSYVGLSVAANRLVLSLTAISSNVWVGTVDR